MSNSKAVENDQGYNISITAKNIEVTTALREHIEGKISKIERLLNQIMEIDVRLDIQKLNHFVDINLKFSHFKIRVKATSNDMYASIDKAFSKLYVKMRKWKSRIQNHHAKGVSITEMEVSVLEHAQEVLEEINDEIIDENNQTLEKHYFPNKIVKRKTRAVKCLTLDEAVMKIELSHDNFFVYRSEEEQKLRIIYRRRDGSLGVMSPEE
jgi:putative sigma-54 modulation protein